MKYRILKNQHNVYIIKYKYKFWPFWFTKTKYIPFGSITHYFNTRLEAEETVKQLTKEPKKSKWVVVRTFNK